LLQISGHTKQLGIIGYPVEHSFSPKMHNFISERLNNDYVYSAWRVAPNELEAAINGIRALGISGVNVTAPHKVEVMKYIDVVSEQAKLLGSVNTIVNRDGKLYGYNTDSEGFYAMLKNAGIDVEDKKLLIIGAGGVVKPTLIRLIQAKPKSITVVNRTKSKVLALKESLKAAMGFEIETEVRDKDYDIVINTTSAGMEPQLDSLPIDALEEFDDLSFINQNTAVVDMIYNPDETLFLKEAKKRGAKTTLNGLGMLINQGIISYEYFTGEKLPEDISEIVKREVFYR
jgi:shikimate dehydrogenase